MLWGVLQLLLLLWEQRGLMVAGDGHPAVVLRQADGSLPLVTCCAQLLLHL
jgi:hypothetical protein